MCGIGGAFCEDGRRPDRAALERMSLAMRERGPDDHGLFQAEGIGLVHRRLSILDLSEAGRCPISNRDGSIQVVHNGEIYNFAELRQALEAKGHAFQSQGDSEVIVHGYREWGEAIFSRLEGIFAIAIWDESRRRLILARDRFGKKPLYLLRKADQLIFASTLNALHAHEGGDLAVNQDAMECYLSHGFIPHPHTIWKRVETFPPAHYGVMEGGGELQIQPYWQFSGSEKRRISVAEAEDQIDEIIDRSVRRRLVADVPVGGFLSGGVDSSLVMARAAAHLPRVDTFSIGFQESEFSELPYARRVAEHIGSNHHELVLDVTSIYDSLPDLVWQYGQPFGDSSAIPTHLVSRLARQDVTVSLSGDGGDESFAGYWRAESGMYADYLRRLMPEPVRSRALPSMVKLLKSLGRSGVADRLDRLAVLASGAPGASYSNNQSWFDSLGSLKGEFFQPDAQDHDLLSCRVGKAFPDGEVGVLRQLLYDDFQVLLPDAYLVKVDVASMAASLEVRCPLLDQELVEAAWSLPDSMKLRGPKRKWLLKRVAERHVPKDVIYRPKQGFALPMSHWWAHGLMEILSELMSESRAVAHGFIQAEPVRQAIDRYGAGDRDHATRLWLVLWLELWTRIVLEGSMDRGTSLVEVLPGRFASALS